MSRQRTIVGIGEALVSEYPDREQPDGLAVFVPLSALRMGHLGVAVSRIGQDQPGSIVRAHLRDRGVNVNHLQYDPDLSTGRLVIRSIAGKTRRTLDAQAAFDNLQWDFDLADLAQVTDAVVFGSVARRYGQTQSAIDRYLSESRSALRVYDMTNRVEGEANRTSVLAGLSNCDGVFIDAGAAMVLMPGISPNGSPAAMEELLRQHELSFAAWCHEDGSMHVYSGEGSATAPSAAGRDVISITITAFVHGLLSGWTIAQCAEQAERIASFARDHRDERIAAELLMRGD